MSRSDNDVMRIAFVTDPYLFTRIGGIQRQIMCSMDALRGIGVHASIYNPETDSLDDFQLAHIFEAESCNFKLVEFANNSNIPVVLSSVISPRWSYLEGLRARLANFFTTNMTAARVNTTYAQVLWALAGADAVIALGQRERSALIKAFRVDPGKISVVPNGVGKEFFSARPDLFREKYNISSDFVLCVGSIQANKNQLSLARSLENEDIRIILIGPCPKDSKPYLDQLLSYGNVTYLGSLDYSNPMLPSAYSACSVLALPSFSEVMPNAVLEALAAGTPVVMTRNHSFDMEFPENLVKQIDPEDIDGMRNAILSLLHDSDRQNDGQRLVEGLGWNSVAQKLKAIYLSLLR